MKNQNFIKTHWNGEFSLPFAYWVIGILVGYSIVIFVTLLIEFIEPLTPTLTYNAWLILIFYPLLWIFYVWIYVGIWKSASVYIAKGKSSIWGFLAKFSVVIGILQVLGIAITVHTPIMQKMSDFAFGSDSLGIMKVELLDDGKTLFLQGIFGNGSSQLVIDTLDKHTTITRLNLNSNGGRLKEVTRLSKEIQRRKLETYTEDNCLSFCTVIFLSGFPRYSTSRARIGFHSPNFFTNDDFIKDIGLDKVRSLYENFDLPKVFIDKIFATDFSDMWYPSFNELVSLGVISNLSLGGESNKLQNNISSFSNEKIYEILIKEPIFAAFELKFPGIVKKVVNQISSVERGLLNDSDFLTIIRSYLSPYSMKAIAQSTPEIRSSFISLGNEQSKYIQTLGPKFCHAFLQQKLDVTKNLPKYLVDKEMELINRALKSKFISPKNYSSIEYEKSIQLAVINMTDEELNAISDLKDEPNSKTCAGLVKFYDGINSLPRLQRDIVIYGLLIQ